MFQRHIFVSALLFILAVGAAIPGRSNDLSGHWEGAISVQGLELALKTDFSLDGETWTGTFDIVQQGALGVPLAEIRCEGGQVHFEIASNLGQAAFDGAFIDAPDNNRIEGLFRQGAAEGRFHLDRGVPAAEPDAEQMPPEDDQLRHEQLALVTTTGTLQATFDLPETGESFPAVLLIPGSGPTDRDGNSTLLPGSNNSLKLVGRALASRGIAVLRIDKRGVAASAAAGAAESELRFEDYVADAQAWIERLQEDPRVSKIGIVGHSEGSLVGMLAARRTGIDAFVSVSGAARPASKLLTEQLAVQPGALTEEVKQVIAQLEAGITTSEVPAGMDMLFRESVQPYLVSWFRLDPVAGISELDIPVLILQGGRDLQVPVSAAESLHSANPDSRLEIIPTMNHILKSVDDDTAANIAAYSDPSLPLAPGFEEILATFLLEILDGEEK